MEFILIYFIIGALFTVISWMMTSKNQTGQEDSRSILIYFGICPFIWPFVLVYFINSFIYNVIKKT